MKFLRTDTITQLEVNGVRYTVRHSGQGEPLLLLHGFTGSSESWNGVAPELERTFTVIRPDLLGHGATDAPDSASRYEMHAAARDLIAILDALEIGQVGVHGYSMGGRLALYLAVTYPERVAGLTLESTSTGLRDALERQKRQADDEALADRIMAGGIAAFVEKWESIPLFATHQRLPAAVRQRQREIRLNNRETGLANSLRGMGTGAQPDLWDRLGGLSMPILLITGRDDHKFDAIAPKMAAMMSDVTHLSLPEAGHVVHLEQPLAWLAAVTLFYQRVVRFPPADDASVETSAP